MASRPDLPAASYIHPSFGRPMDVSSVDTVGWTDEQITAGTICIMARLVREDTYAPEVTAAAQQILSTLPEGADDHATLTAVFDWVKQHVKYVGDEEEIEPFDFYFPPEELLIRPAALLQMPEPKDDCDGFSMLVCAIASNLGFATYFKTVAVDSQRPQLYTHVYAVIRLSDGTRFPIDASHGPAAGLEVQPTFKHKIWPINDMKTPLYRKPSPHAARALAGLAEIDWGQILNQGIASTTKIAESVLIPRYGVPPAGTTIIDSGTGAKTISTYPGGGVTAIGTGSSGTLLILGGVGLVVLLLATRK